MSSSSRRNSPAATVALTATVIALLTAFALAADSDAPPLGITPAPTTVRGVLTAYHRAQGRLRPASTTTVEDWTVDVGGLLERRHDVRRGDDERVDTTVGTLHVAHGTLGAQSWSQNYSGEVVRERGIHHADDISDRALETTLPTAGVTLLGQVASPMPAYVVRVAPSGGRLEYVFFDKKTGLIDRTESMRQGHREITTYEDFRSTDGETHAWHIHVTGGDNDVDYRLSKLQYGIAIDPSALAIPLNRNPLTFASSTLTLPAKIVDDRVIVTVTIDGRPINMQLDSGASALVLDQRVADALHLVQAGTFTGETAGKYPTRLASIPIMTVGGVTADNVVVATAPFESWADEKTPVAGLLGFDFIAGCVVHIDYVKGTLQAIDPATFVPPAGATAIPIALDDRVPIVTATIGRAVADAFILDTGADRSTLFSSFVDAHPRDTADWGLGTEEQATFPFITRFEGVGGLVKYRQTDIAPFAFAGYVFPQWLFGATYDAPAFDFEDYDGLIGQDVLRNFDVYLDYPHLKIYILPNDRYKERWGP